MKPSTQYRISASVVFCLSSLSAAAQSGQINTIQIDTFTKIIGVLATIAGFFMAFMQMKTATKIAEVEARFNKAINDIQKEFEKKIESETDKLENKIALSSKEIEARMATRHDIDNMKTVVKLQHENTNLQLSGLKAQLDLAAKILHKTKENE